MKLRGLLRIVWWGGLVAFVVYVAVGTLSNYFKTVELVESALDAAGRIEKLRTTGPEVNHVSSVRDAIVQGARRTELPLDERKLSVTQTGSTVHVRLKWSFLAVTWDDQAVLAIPMSLDRSYNLR